MLDFGQRSVVSVESACIQADRCYSRLLDQLVARPARHSDQWQMIRDQPVVSCIQPEIFRILKLDLQEIQLDSRRPNAGQNRPSATSSGPRFRLFALSVSSFQLLVLLSSVRVP